MVNFRILSKIIGSLLFIEAFFMAWCLAMAFGYREDDTMAFLLSTLLTFGCGCLFLFFGRQSGNSLSRRDAYLVVTAVWIIFSCFGMFPYLFHGTITNFTDAYFESMSGFTTTGCSTLDDLERLPHAMLFWRSLTQWIGGLGIVFFTIAILPSLVGGSMKVFAAEATGPVKAKMHPRLTTSAKWIWSVYLFLTVVCALCFWLADMDWFDAINYAMTTTATGGFSTHNDATIYFNSALIDYIAILFQFLAGINFTLLYLTLFKFRVGNLLRNAEFKFYVTLVTAFTVGIAAMLVVQVGYDYEPAFRSALFQVVSFVTTTGVFNDNVALWPHLTWVLLGVLMFIGACAGSTTGGFKSVRAVMLLKVLRNEFRHILHPNAVLPVKLGDQTVPQSRIISLLAFFIAFTLMVLLTTTIMVVAGIDNTNAITIALSCMSNVGPSLATDIGENILWSQLPDIIKWACSLLMLMGRLEIMTVLVLFTPSYWKDS
jgi:trk system potassium uptake protein TrkH